MTLVPCVHWSGCPEKQDMARRCGRSIGHAAHADMSSLLRRFGRATRRCAEKVQQRMQWRPWRVLLAAPCPQRAAGDGGRHSSKDVVSRAQPGLAGPGLAPASCCWGRQWWSIPLCKHIGHLGRCSGTRSAPSAPPCCCCCAVIGTCWFARVMRVIRVMRQEACAGGRAALAPCMSGICGGCSAAAVHACNVPSERQAGDPAGVGAGHGRPNGIEG